MPTRLRTSRTHAPPGLMLLAIVWLALAGCASSAGDEEAALEREPVATRFSEASGPLRIAIAGLVHQHAERLLSSAEAREDIEIVGVAEPNRELFARLADQFGLDPALRFDTLEQVLAQTRPEVVSAMTSIADHARVVEVCAPQGVHVFAEKPLAFSRHDARRMRELSARHGVLVLTNFETSWYDSVREAARLVENGDFGPLRKMIFRHGHRGPIEIGCYPEFTDWLTTPEAGGGALVDFGCYGAVLSSWLMGNAQPLRVVASAQTIRPGAYPRVDDDATIVLEYPGASAVIQASWNWTHDVKEMDLFMESGSLHAGRGSALTARGPDAASKTLQPGEPAAHLRDQWTYLRQAVRGECEIDALSSLELNVTVAGILDDARRQVKQRRRSAARAAKPSLPPAPRTPRQLGLGGRRRGLGR